MRRTTAPPSSLPGMLSRGFSPTPIEETSQTDTWSPDSDRKIDFTYPNEDERPPSQPSNGSGAVPGGVSLEKTKLQAELPIDSSPLLHQLTTGTEGWTKPQPSFPNDWPYGVSKQCNLYHGCLNEPITL